MNRKLLVLFFALVLMTGSVYAQTPPKSESAPTGWITESGFITGMGTGSTSEGQYQPILLIWHLASDLKRYISPLQNHKGTLSVTCEPQINPAFNPQTAIEFGVGFGLQYAYPITPKISPYVMGSVGPHYITLQNEHQANGFIFSDTVGVGLYYYLDKKSAINLGYRYRHISNADLKSPNGGLDTQFGIIGYSVFF
jgi:hypothetical protein